MSATSNSNNEQLEKLYLPSNWSRRYGPMELLARYFKFCEETTSQARCSIKHELDIPYGAGEPGRQQQQASEKTRYDIYGTDLPKDAPILLFIHGGYWQEFSKDLSGFVVPNLVANGIKVIVGGYDLCPTVTLTEIVREIKQLAQTVLQLARSSGSKCVWIAGHSAGAHLAASLLHDNEWLESMADKLGCGHLLKGLVLISGIYALEPLLRLSVNDLLQLTADEVKQFTFAPLDAAAAADGGNTETELSRNLKVLVTVGECDSPVFLEESRRYAARITKFVDNVEFLLIRDNIDHFDIVENLTKSDFSLSKIIINNITYSLYNH